MFGKIYESSIIEKPKFTLLVLIILLLSFGYFAKDFQLDASSDTLLLENDPDENENLIDKNLEIQETLWKRFLEIQSTKVNN